MQYLLLFGMFLLVPMSSLLVSADMLHLSYLSTLDRSQVLLGEVGTYYDIFIIGISSVLLVICT